MSNLSKWKKVVEKRNTFKGSLPSFVETEGIPGPSQSEVVTKYIVHFTDLPSNQNHHLVVRRSRVIDKLSLL